MIGTRPRPTRTPPARIPRKVGLTVLPEPSPHPDPLPEYRERETSASSVGDPFNPHKILNHFDRLSRLVKGELVYPITVEIDPTNVCNHRCKWCVSLEAHTGESLDLDTMRRLIDELAASDVKSIVLKGGGEPTAHPKIVETLDLIRSAGLSVGMITNGSMPRTGTREKVLEACQWVRVSLDAATSATHRTIHGTTDFGRIIDNVKYLASAGDRVMVGLNFVAEPRNYHEMAAFAKMGRELDVAYVTIRCVFDPSSPLSEDTRAAMREQAIAARQYEAEGFRVFLGNFTEQYLNAKSTQPFPHARCLGPNLIGIVGGDGDVYACCFLRGNKRFSFGNVAEQSFTEIWKSPRRKAVMEAVYRGECGRVCAGGMTANRYNTYNEILNYLAAEEKRHAEFA
jgi:radical SAM protein with 4Fe4S-binding SPASM domain